MRRGNLRARSACRRNRRIDQLPTPCRQTEPNGDGVLSDAEMKAWDPNLSPPPVQNDLRRFDNTGNQLPAQLTGSAHQGPRKYGLQSSS